MSINHLLITDMINKSFIDHRHDQSILSEIVCKYGSLKLLDETYFVPNWETHGINYPFGPNDCAKLVFSENEKVISR